MLQIIRVPILPFGLVNAHLIKGNKGLVLVDAGLPGTEKKLHAALAKQGHKFDDIKLIVVTHAHVDHAGNAARIQQLSGAPILAHEDDLPFYLREQPMSFCATGLFGRIFLKTGLMNEPYEPFKPNILLRDFECVKLNEWGIDGVVRHTPGHTAGSISIELSGNHCMVGDLIASGILLGGIAFTGHPKPPPFEDNPILVAQQLQDMLASGGQHFYMGHGGPLSAKQVERHVCQVLKQHGHAH